MVHDDDTTRILQLVDVDAQFRLNVDQSTVPPIILNEIDLTQSDYVERISEKIFSDGSGVDFMARCQCGETEGNNKEGMTCPICGTEVTHVNLLDDNNLYCRNWVSAPIELPGGWLAPKIYLNLAYWLSYDKGKRNYLDDILNVDTPIPYDLVNVIDGKGFAYLFEHFDRIMKFFIHDHPVVSQKPDSQAMRLCLQLNREKVWCHYVPILPAAINPITSSEGTGSRKRYSDTTADYIMQAIVSLSRLKHASRRDKKRQNYVERTTFKAYKDIIAYVEDATAKYISTKKAIPRTHIFGCRFHTSFRAVVVPIVGQHKYYELHVPWRMAVNTLRVPILGILCREHGLTITQATSKHRRALQIIDQDIQVIMDRLIADTPFMGIPCVWDRPPSIRDGSVMLKYWTKIKPDLEDSCVGVTAIDAKLPNLDFDGDNLSGIIIPETDMVRAMRSLSPSALIWNRNTGEVSDEIGVPRTLCLTLNSFLENV